MTARRIGPSLTLAAWFLILAASAWVLVFRTEYIFDITRFLPRDDPAVAILQDLQSSQSARLILIGIEGGSEQERAAVSLAVAASLRNTGLFSRVENGSGRLGGAQVRALFEHRYLLSPTVEAARFTEAGLREALRARLQELSSPMSMVQERLLPADPTGEAQSLLRSWLADGRHPESRSGVWSSPDGSRALLLAETTAASFDAPAQQKAVAAIREAFAGSQRDHSGLRLLLGGPGVLAVASQELVRSEAERLSTVATVLIVLLLGVAYRSPRAVVLSVLPLVSAILVGAAVTSAAFGSIHGITLGFGCTLLGICGDYPIVLMSFVRGGRPVREQLRRVAPIQRLCAALTCIGYLALLSPSFPGLSQVGVFSTVGLITAMLVTHKVLPVLLPARWEVRGRPHGWRPTMPSMRPLLLPAWPWGGLLAAMVGIAAAIVLIVHPPAWEDDIAAISPVPRALLAVDQELRTALRAPEAGHVIIIHGADAEAVLQKSEAVATVLAALVAEGSLQDFVAPSQFLPSAAMQRRRQAALPEPGMLREALSRAAAGLPFRPNLFEPFLADVEANRTAQPINLETLRGTPADSVVGALLFTRADQGWAGLVSLTGVAKPDAIAAALRQASIPDVRYLAVRQETNRLMAELRNEALWRLAAGVAAMILVLAVSLRSPARIANVVLPVALALLVDVAALTAMGQRLSLLHLISLLLVAGLAVDYAIVLSKAGADADFAARALQATLLCCTTTLLSFGLLATAPLPVLQTIGTTVAIGVSTTFVLAFLLTRPPHPASPSSAPVGADPASRTASNVDPFGR